MAKQETQLQTVFAKKIMMMISNSTNDKLKLQLKHLPNPVGV